jgi:Spy/CpxP family protein refolding chaperone
MEVYPMKVTKKVLAATFALITPISIGLAQATYAGNVPTGNLIDKDFEVALRKWVTKRFYNRIDATDDQRQKLDSLFSATQEETRPMREQFRRGLLELSDMMAGETATDEEIQAKVKDVREIKQKIMDQRINTALAARKVLTPAQRQKIHDRISDIISGNIKPRRLGMLLDEQ